MSFYHLELVDTRSGQRTALLLGDRAGEEYRAAADDVQSVASLVEVNRADVLTILVDGKRLIDNIARHNVRVDVSMTLQALQDGGGLTSRPRVAMVLTKLDLVKASAVQARAFRDFARIAALVQETFGANLGEVSTFQVAAAPRRSDVDRGIGVDSLIEYWMRPRLAPVARIAKALLPDRMFARLAPGNAPSGDAL
ncbi:MAG: hypothetical protein IH627_12075 [Rubrivivax sp.]|nr:hypothetical protein [Rubrivivax sp.]